MPASGLAALLALDLRVYLNAVNVCRMAEDLELGIAEIQRIMQVTLQLAQFKLAVALKQCVTC